MCHGAVGETLLVSAVEGELGDQRGTKMKLGALALAGLLLIGWSAAPTSRVTAAEPDAVCVGEWTVQFTPPVDRSLARSTFASEGGTVTCVGQLNGRDVTGVEGQLRDWGVLVGSCLEGDVTGMLSLTIPTAGEPTTLTFAYEGAYVPGVGSTSSDHHTDVFQFRPTEGDCLTTPVSEVAIVDELVVHK